MPETSGLSQFEISSRQIAEKFVQTVVVVDDEIASTPDDSQPVRLRRQPSYEGVAHPDQVPTDPTSRDVSARRATRAGLNSQRIVDRFAKNGFVLHSVVPGE